MQRTLLKNADIAIVGGGTAGATAALYLGVLGLNVTLFEKGKSLVSGPPMCHLHAGGNLYREISDEQCITLLKQSVDLVRYYPYAVDYRPTVIAVPTQDSGSPQDLFRRLDRLTNEYEKLIQEDPANKVLGENETYYKVYEREAIEKLCQKEIVENPTEADEWMIPVAKQIDMESIKFPLILVQEYGLNIFRWAAGLTLSLEQLANCDVRLNTSVTNVTQLEGSEGWQVCSKDENGKQEEKSFDYLINAAGFRTGTIDDMLGYSRDRLVEFKAAYVTKWEGHDNIWPEVVFYGERGTPRGMGQFTPYPGGYFQLHGMTKHITLFDEGVAESTKESAQPKLPQHFIEKIDNRWEESEVRQRTTSAIHHLSQYIPSFKEGRVASKPLFGAQQVPGDDITLRAADVTFEKERYARCEIVKTSSVLSMSDAITRQLIELGYLDPSVYGIRSYEKMPELNEEAIARLAQTFAKERGYPASLSGRLIA